MHEKAPFNSNPSPELSAEAQLLLVPGAVDAAPLAETGLPISPNQAGVPLSPEEAIAPQPGDQRELAEQILTQVETTALEEAVQGQENPGPSLFSAVEAAEKNQHVAEARHTLEDIFSADEAHAIERVALEGAIKNSELSSQSAPEIVEAAVAGNSPLEAVGKQISAEATKDLTHAVEQLAELKDDTNGQADGILTKVSKAIKKDLDTLGITGRSLKSLNARVVEGSGATVTKTAEAHRAEMRVVGADIVSALADDTPRLSVQKRRELVEQLDEDPAALVLIARQVAEQRSGKRISDRSAELVGDQVLKHVERRAAA